MSLILKLICILILLFFCLPSYAKDVVLAWDANSETDLAGYKIYIGESSRNYGPPIVIGLQTTYTVVNLPPGIYYFAVTAYNTSNAESDYSNEVSTEIDDGLQISSQSASLNWFGVVCLATTTNDASAIFKYKKVGASKWTTIIATPGAIKKEHRAIVYIKTGENPGYWNYKWTMTDSNSKVVTATGTFETR